MENQPTPMFDIDDEVIARKIIDAQTHPGLMVEFDPDEADALGAFEETAMTMEEALDGALDLLGEHGDEPLP